VALVGASPRGNHSLFGLEVATLGQGPDCPSVNEQDSIDDEYAPAVFQVRVPWDRDGWECKVGSLPLAAQKIHQPLTVFLKKDLWAGDLAQW